MICSINGAAILHVEMYFKYTLNLLNFNDTLLYVGFMTVLYSHTLIANSKNILVKHEL